MRAYIQLVVIELVYHLLNVGLKLFVLFYKSIL